MLAVILGILLVWWLLPGIFDSSSKSVFGSKNRQSPLARVAGPRTVVSAVSKVAEDHYSAHPFRLDAPSNVTVKVTYVRGPKVEVYVLDQGGYQEFDAAAGALFGGQFHHFNLLGGQVSKKAGFSKSGGLPAGDYVVLVDNTDFGDVTPPMNMDNDVSEVRVEVIVE